MITFKVLDEAENSLRDRNWKSTNKTNRIVSNRIEWNSLKASTSRNHMIEFVKKETKHFGRQILRGRHMQVIDIDRSI